MSHGYSTPESPVQMPLLAAFLPWVSLTAWAPSGQQESTSSQFHSHRDVGKALLQLSIRLGFHALQACNQRIQMGLPYCQWEMCGQSLKAWKQREKTKEL